MRLFPHGGDDEVLAPPVNMAGDYTVTFMADSACTALPNEMRTRTYAATIGLVPNSVPANAYVSVPLSGASFYKYFNDLSMGVAGDYVGFWLEVLVEQIAPDTFLSFGGLAYASIPFPAGWAGWREVDDQRRHAIRHPTRSTLTFDRLGPMSSN
jgi:hypothetical protein